MPMRTSTKLKLAWRFRRPLWKYRAVLRYRREIAAAVFAAGAVALVTGLTYSRKNPVPSVP
jgi:hypothetical protein